MKMIMRTNRTILFVSGTSFSWNLSLRMSNNSYNSFSSFWMGRNTSIKTSSHRKFHGFCSYLGEEVSSKN